MLWCNVQHKLQASKYLNSILWLFEAIKTETVPFCLWHKVGWTEMSHIISSHCKGWQIVWEGQGDSRGVVLNQNSDGWETELTWEWLLNVSTFSWDLSFASLAASFTSWNFSANWSYKRDIERMVMISGKNKWSRLSRGREHLGIGQDLRSFSGSFIFTPGQLISRVFGPTQKVSQLYRCFCDLMWCCRNVPSHLGQLLLWSEAQSKDSVGPAIRPLAKLLWGLGESHVWCYGAVDDHLVGQN